MLVISQVASGKPRILHHPNLADDDRIRKHGRGTHTPLGTLAVGESATVIFEFEIGEQPVVDGGELLVVWRWPFDWSDLQDSRPDAAGYMRAEVTSAGDSQPLPRLSLRYNWIAGIEPWHHQLQIKVSGGVLKQRDHVRVVCGDTTDGGSGWHAPTCADQRCSFLMLIDHNGDGTRTRLVPTPSFRIEPGPPERTTAILPLDAVVNEETWLIVTATDRWGNPAHCPSPPILSVCPADGLGAGDVSITGPLDMEMVRPAWHYRMVVHATGSYTIQAGMADGSVAVSNTQTVHETSPELKLFWGDLHAGQSEIGCGCGSLAENYEFARDCAGLQFITHQANDHYVTQDDWLHTREVTARYYQPGWYVPLLGCEWSPLTKDGGDRNVIYRDDEPLLRRSDRFFIEDPPDPVPDVRTAPEFHAAFRELDVLVNMHVGGRMTNLQWHEPAIERLCECHSTHGTVEWFFLDAIARGYQVGLTAGTDGVMGRPGACHPGRRLIRNCRNGLTAVYARELTREAIWEALQNRHCYATTGARLRIMYRLNGALMGSALTAAPGTNLDLEFSVDGTDAIERIDLFRDTECILSWPVAESDVRSPEDTHRLRVLWGGTERRGTARLQRVCWDGSLSIDQGTLRVVSPVNFQSVDDSARNDDDRRVTWSSQTAGNHAGVLLEVDARRDALIRFESGPATFMASLGDLLEHGIRVDAGGVNRFVQIGCPPRADGPRSCHRSLSVPVHETGTAAWWIRVVQADQHMAWCSPVYVTVQS